jgi:hypothetical protein
LTRLRLFLKRFIHHLTLGSGSLSERVNTKLLGGTLGMCNCILLSREVLVHLLVVCCSVEISVRSASHALMAVGRSLDWVHERALRSVLAWGHLGCNSLIEKPIHVHGLRGMLLHSGGFHELSVGASNTNLLRKLLHLHLLNGLLHGLLHLLHLLLGVSSC